MMMALQTNECLVDVTSHKTTLFGIMTSVRYDLWPTTWSCYKGVGIVPAPTCRLTETCPAAWCQGPPDPLTHPLVWKAGHLCWLRQGLTGLPNIRHCISMILMTKHDVTFCGEVG